jgi:Domain of unknown function (DUF4260)
VLERLPSTLLRLEGLALFGGAVVLYADGDYGWVAFAVLLLAPDLSILGYLVNTRVGAALYDALHTTLVPIAVGVTGALADAELAVQLALIWLAHIGLDRLLGYGLKYPTSFKDTHLQRV